MSTIPAAFLVVITVSGGGSGGAQIIMSFESVGEAPTIRAF